MRNIDEKESWERFEKVVERVVKKARAEELEDIVEAVETLAEYMKTIFEKNTLNTSRTF